MATFMVTWLKDNRFCFLLFCLCIHGQYKKRENWKIPKIYIFIFRLLGMLIIDSGFHKIRVS